MTTWNSAVTVLGVVYLLCFTFVDFAGSERVTGAENQEFQCNKNIDSRTSENGTIMSPNHPRPYPADITCRYTFSSVGRERVQLRFTHFDLHFPSGNPNKPIDCGGSDSISAYIVLDGVTEQIKTSCGKQLPPMLMSSQHKMIVEFRSYHSSRSVTGFKAEYSFVTNFGIHHGQQDKRGTCSFNYRSIDSSSGQITSPNYNGLYPRNTECFYNFFGQHGERVKLQFIDFDVDGISPRCGNDTKSDFVSFSNFAETEDRKMTKLCGRPSRDKRIVTSDGPFFKVVFKSNEIYDSKGFQAHYQFIGPPSDDKGSLKRGTGVNTDTYTVQDSKRNSGNSNLQPSYGSSHGGFFPLAPFPSVTVVCLATMLILLPPNVVL